MKIIKPLIITGLILSLPSLGLVQQLAFNFYDTCPEIIIQNINLLKAEYFTRLDALVKTKDLPSNKVEEITSLLNQTTERMLDLSNIETLTRRAEQDDEFAKNIIAETKNKGAKGANTVSKEMALANKINQCQASVQAAISELQTITQMHQNTVTRTVQSAIMVEYLDQFNEKLNELVQTSNLIHANAKSLNNQFPCFQSNCVSG